MKGEAFPTGLFSVSYCAMNLPAARYGIYENGS